VLFARIGFTFLWNCPSFHRACLHPTPLETFIPYHGRVIADCVTNFLNLMEKFVHLYMRFGCPLDFADAMNVE
jgi:hypothetical protein